MDKLLSQPAVKISFITAIITLALAGLKIFFGYAGESHALVADGFHSLADVLVALLVLFAAQKKKKKRIIIIPMVMEELKRLPHLD